MGLSVAGIVNWNRRVGIAHQTPGPGKSLNFNLFAQFRVYYPQFTVFPSLEPNLPKRYTRPHQSVSILARKSATD
jgi:hypothetical protein